MCQKKARSCGRTSNAAAAGGVGGRSHLVWQKKGVNGCERIYRPGVPAHTQGREQQSVSWPAAAHWVAALVGTPRAFCLVSYPLLPPDLSPCPGSDCPHPPVKRGRGSGSRCAAHPTPPHPAPGQPEEKLEPEVEAVRLRVCGLHREYSTLDTILGG